MSHKNYYSSNFLYFITAEGEQSLLDRDADDWNPYGKRQVSKYL